MKTLTTSYLGLLALVLLAGTRTSFPQTLTVTNELRLWLKADAGVTTNASGGVMQWVDQSTNANNATQTIAAQAPALINGALNSRPVLRFDGGDDFLNVADSESLSGTGDMASFFVVKFDDFATYRAVWGKTAGTDNNLPAPTDIYALPDSGVLRVFRGDGTFDNLSAADTAQPLRANAYLVLGFDVAGGTLTHYLNNQTNGGGPVTTNTADANTPLKIGTRNDLGTRLKGDLAELLIYSRALSAIERSNVFSYLQTKYDLLNLPPTVTLSSTPAGPNVNIGQIVTLDATPNDLDGTIAKVDFFSSGVLLGTATQPPYALRVTIESAGTAQFTARATDDKGAFADSAPLSLTASGGGTPALTATNGLQLWLKADAGTTVSGNAVTQWDDQSGHANHASQPVVGLAPVLTNNAVNGRPALRFDGADDFMDVADSASISITGDIASFFVVRFADFATYRAVWGKTLVNQPAPTDFYAASGTGVPTLVRGTGMSGGAQFATGSRAFTAGTFLQAAFVQAGTTATHYLNGLANGSATITVQPVDADLPLKIGSRADLFTILKGEMAELLIYDRAPPAAERRTIERYLASKYNLPPLVSTANTLPSVAIVSPLGVVQAPGMVTVTANATDADGSIVSVQILANGLPIGTDTNAPYTAVLNVPFGGAVTVSAITTDNLGAQSISTPVRVCVQGPSGPSGLICYWPLDGNANAVVGINGLMVSNPVPAMDRNGVAGGALSFNGAMQQRIEVPGGGGLNAATVGTIAMLVKWTGTQDADCCGSFGAVLGRQRNGIFSDNIISLNNASPDSAVVQWRQNGAGAVNITGSAIVMNDAWRHIAVTFTETNSELFVDGTSQGMGGGGALHDHLDTPLAIGAWIGDGGGYATATIDEVAIWNRVLSIDEIQDLAAGFKTVLGLSLAPDCLTIERSGTNVVVRWRSDGILQGASEVTGSYTDVIDPAAIPPGYVPSPYTNAVSAARTFYRLRSPSP
jgi:hypothetical protein